MGTPGPVLGYPILVSGGLGARLLDGAMHLRFGESGLGSYLRSFRFLAATSCDVFVMSVDGIHLI